MPSVYDYHHIELDKVGRGKKRVSMDSVDGGIKSVLINGKSENGAVNGTNGIQNGLNGLRNGKTNGENCVLNGSSSNGRSNGLNSTGSSQASSPTSSRSASRRGSIVLDTKNRLFGPAITEQPKKVKDLFKSTIFTPEANAITPPTNKIAQAKVKSVFTPARRNPITGETLATNGNNLSSSACVTPVSHRVSSLSSSIGSASPATASITSSSLSMNSSSDSIPYYTTEATFKSSSRP